MVKSLVKKILNKKGYDIVSYDPYFDKIKKVNYLWLNKFNIDTIIDVGASDGGYVKKIRAILPVTPIVSFEPIKESFDKLVESNSQDKNFSAQNCVLSNTEGVVDFFISSRSGCSSLLEMTDLHKTAYPETAGISKITVASKKLDDCMINCNFNSALLKIDVQGAEKFVLEGATKTLERVKIIFMEINFVETYKDCLLINESVVLLKSYGFNFYGIENVSQSLIDGSFLQADAYFIRTS